MRVYSLHQGMRCPRALGLRWRFHILPSMSQLRNRLLPFGSVLGASGPSASIQFLMTRVDDETPATTAERSPLTGTDR